MVFLIQNTQNRDAHGDPPQARRAAARREGARTGLVELENFTDDELAELQEEFDRLHQRLAGRALPPTDEAPGSMPQ